jgi:hypothetical protein
MFRGVVNGFNLSFSWLHQTAIILIARFILNSQGGFATLLP